MGTLGTGHDHRKVRHLQQGQIVGGIPQGQHLHIRFMEALLQSRQGVSLADLSAKQMTHPVTAHNGKPLGRRQGIKARLDRH